MTEQAENLAVLLKSEQDMARLEQLADEAAEKQDRNTIGPLLSRLLEDRVRADDDTFAAICGALTTLGVMRERGNLNYEFVAREALPGQAIEALRQLAPYLPASLFPESSPATAWS